MPLGQAEEVVLGTIHSSHAHHLRQVVSFERESRFKSLFFRGLLDGFSHSEGLHICLFFWGSGLVTSNSDGTCLCDSVA